MSTVFFAKTSSSGYVTRCRLCLLLPASALALDAAAVVVDVLNDYAQDEAQAILGAENVAIRFQGDKRQLDAEVSQTELEALETIYAIDAVVSEIVHQANQE